MRDRLIEIIAGAMVSNDPMLDVHNAADAIIAAGWTEPDTHEDGRRKGHSKLVFDKVNRTIAVVDPHPSSRSPSDIVERLRHTSASRDRWDAQKLMWKAADEIEALRRANKAWRKLAPADTPETWITEQHKEGIR